MARLDDERQRRKAEAERARIRHHAEQIFARMIIEFDPNEINFNSVGSYALHAIRFAEAFDEEWRNENRATDGTAIDSVEYGRQRTAEVIDEEDGSES